MLRPRRLCKARSIAGVEKHDPAEGRGHRHRARSFRRVDLFGYTGDGGQLTTINQVIKKASVFITEEQGRMIE
jgi:hypothetical protein